MKPIRLTYALLVVLLLTGPVFCQDDPLLRDYRNPPGEFKQQVVELARQGVELYLKQGVHMSPAADVHPLLRRSMGAFVTITLDGKVRGCMGSLHPVEQDVAGEIIRSAIMAATVDPWNKPVTPAELPRLKYTVTFAGTLQRVESEMEINTGREGIFVRRGSRGALLLPGEALTSQWALFRCRQKAGIPQDMPVDIFKFQTATFSDRYRSYSN